MRKELEQNQEELREVEQNQAQLTEEVERNREHIITNRKLITNITFDFDINKQEITDLTTSLDGQIAVIQVNIAALKHNDTQLQTQIDKLQDDFDGLMHDVDVMNLTTFDKINVLNGNISNIKHDIKAIQDKVIELNITDSGLNITIDNLKDNLEVLQIKFNDLALVQQYCIEVIPHGSNRGDAISILKNGQLVDTIKRNFIVTHKTCFDSFDVENDIRSISVRKLLCEFYDRTQKLQRYLENLNFRII